MLHLIGTVSWGSDQPTPQTYGRPRRLVVGCLRIITVQMDRLRQRKALDSLDDRLLRDIGITRDDAQRESTAPFWR